jgi:hypothetical protein
LCWNCLEDGGGGTNVRSNILFLKETKEILKNNKIMPPKEVQKLRVKKN